MLLTISTTYDPATDLGYLLHKHPDKVQTFSLSFGRAHVFYPEATAVSCTAALMLDIDPIKLSRQQGGDQASFALQPYVNNRPYVASSFLSVAIAQVYGTALNGRCKDRPELVDTPIPLQAKIATLPSHDGESLLHRLFTPLGYTLHVIHQPLDAQFPEWGDSHIYTVTLTHTIRLRELLTHLYVLIPVLDDEKHYWVGADEVDKLLQKGESWLTDHPEREEIAHRFLRRQRRLTRAALAQLTEEDDPDPEATGKQYDQEETNAESSLGLHQQRLQAVLDMLKASGAARVLDLGCGEGRLLRMLLQESQFKAIVGMDVSYRSLELAAERLKLERLPERQRERITLLHGSLLYRDQRLVGYDAAAVVEVIEHLDAPRLAAFVQNVFAFTQPQIVLITTPNQEYNVMWPSLPAQKFRHRDHRFEWTRAEFQTWATKVADTHGYTVRFTPIGPEDETVGAPSQMAIFTREHIDENRTP